MITASPILSPTAGAGVVGGVNFGGSEGGRTIVAPWVRTSTSTEIFWLVEAPSESVAVTVIFVSPVPLAEIVITEPRRGCTVATWGSSDTDS